MLTANLDEIYDHY